MHLYRTHTCTQLRATDAGQTVKLSGWVFRMRDHGGILFIDLRDHYGITQVVVTHDVDFAKKIATDIVYLENGQIVEMGGCEHFDHPETVQFKEYLSH